MPPAGLLAPSAVLIGVAVSVALIAPRAHLAVSAVVTLCSSAVAAIGVSAVVVAETGDAERHRLTEVLASLCIAGVLGGLVAAAVAIVVARPEQVARCRPARAGVPLTDTVATASPEKSRSSRDRSCVRWR